jgi:hypothetical protein
MNDTIYRRDAIQALVDTEEIKGFAYRMLEDRLIKLPSANKWTPCDKKLPKAEEKVWIQTKRGKVCFAMYEDGTISEADSDWHWYDLDFENWDEENDCGIIPEGWWEWTEFHPDDEFDCPVDEEVVAWMPLPEPWKGADDEIN